MMKIRGALLAVLGTLLVAAALPSGASALGGGNCGAYPNYIAAYSEFRCGPIGIINNAFIYSSDSAGNITNANVCVQLEENNYPYYTPVSGKTWACNAGSSVILGDGGARVAGYRMGNTSAAHYAITQYWFN